MAHYTIIKKFEKLKEIKSCPVSAVAYNLSLGMDAKPLEYQRTKQYEWVTTNGFDAVLLRLSGRTETEIFHINHYFKDVWEHMDEIEKGNLMLVDSFLGRPGAIRMVDAMYTTSQAMQKYSCNSSEMKNLKNYMLAYFKHMVGKMAKALK